MKNLPPAKSLSTQQNSTSIVVSFDDKWEEYFANESIKYFIRKRLPKTFQPDTFYAYFSSPLSRISCIANIESITNESVEDVLRISEKLLMSKAEIELYCEGYKTVSLCEIGKVLYFKKPIPMKTLKENLIFFPPQSFLILSEQGKEIIENLSK
jgi:predicted transcriptional regulator